MDEKMNDALKVIRDVLEDIKKENVDKAFWLWDNSDIQKGENVFLSLICGIKWRNSVEAYEYLTYIINNTYLAIRKFKDENVDIVFWEPVVRYYFNKSLNILDDSNSMDYKVLSNYFPLTDALKTCSDALSKLNVLLSISRQTEGAVSQEVKDLYKTLYDRMTGSFNEVVKGNDYISDKDAMTVYKTLVLNGLSAVITFENMNSLQSLTDPNGKINHPGIKTEKKNKKKEVNDNLIEITSADEPKNDISNPVSKVSETLVQHIEKSVSEPTIVEQPKVEEPTVVEEIKEEIKVEEPVVEPTVEETQPKVEEKPIEETKPVEEPVKAEPPKPLIDYKKNVNIEPINKLLELDNKGNAKNFEINEFIEQFQILQSYNTMAKRNGNEENVTYFCGILGNLFALFDKEYKKILDLKQEKQNNPKKFKHFNVDFDKWDEARKHIDNFKRANNA